MRPAYVVFHKWLAANRKRIAAGRDRTVIYSGMNSGRIPIWSQLRLYERFLSLELGTNPRWEPIQTVLTRLPCSLPTGSGSSGRGSRWFRFPGWNARQWAKTDAFCSRAALLAI